MQSLFFILLVLGSINMVSTLICHVCKSDATPQCGDPFIPNNSTGINLGNVPNGTVCMKTKRETKGGVKVDRQFTLTSNTFGCLGGVNGCFEETVSGITTTTCCCNTRDSCNGVSVVQQQPLVVFIILSTLVMFTNRLF
ncbi:unnamed protein product [Rotaria socialis]|uniref:Protein quiver n=1 Tax=Rotaria socialis TaxID=392032 RepID=A0A820TNR2_9BILA|nr:unnamed protein product [Rotaria socialis]CAF4468688.1 unnamed protein product [Rotaria socialis]